MFEERPVLGFGTSGFEAMSIRFLGYDEAYPHDAVLQFAAEYGLAGAALFVSLILVGLLRRLPAIGWPVKVLFVYFLLEGMLSGDIFADRATWGLLLILFLMTVPSVIAQVTESGRLAGSARPGRAMGPRPKPRAHRCLICRGPGRRAPDAQRGRISGSRTAGRCSSRPGRTRS